MREPLWKALSIGMPIENVIGENVIGENVIFSLHGHSNIQQEWNDQPECVYSTHSASCLWNQSQLEKIISP